MVFLSHCILNVNTRYPGGACRGSCVSEIVNQCIEKNIGMVQMPCPEQHTWGGVSKHLLLMAYGAKGTVLYACRHFAIPLVLLYTKRVYGWMAWQTARRIQDYLDSGFVVRSVVGVDGSPSCGVTKTLDFNTSFEVLAHINIDSVQIEDANRVVSECLTIGKGFFIQALQKILARKKINICFQGHDLMAELEGKRSNVII